MAAARVNHRLVLLGDARVLVAGGGTTGASVTPANPSSELFIPATNAFSPGPAMITPRLFHTATRLSDGSVLVAGGERPGQILSSAERFVPSPHWSRHGCSSPSTAHGSAILSSVREPQLHAMPQAKAKNGIEKPRIRPSARSNV